MHFVTLTSDWNKDDFYTGAIKGSILSSCEQVKIITLTNRIRSYSITEAAFIVRNSYAHFPENTVHIIAVGTEAAPGASLLAARINGHYFLTADNGIVGLLGDSGDAEIVELARDRHAGAESFPALKYFSKAACSIINGATLQSLGKITEAYKKQVPLRPTVEDNTIMGSVIYIDSYGNAITNIAAELFQRIGKNRPFTIFVQSKHYRISVLNRYYAETTPGDLLALFNSVNLLEIAIHSGSARELLNLNTNSTVRIEFNTERK